ncbi:MAG: F0F1 ATP synthase subunit A [Bacteroidia bacterium]|nr:F0F1 ATP synthase subunit A [Bacteroidia bacterium]
MLLALLPAAGAFAQHEQHSPQEPSHHGDTIAPAHGADTAAHADAAHADAHAPAAGAAHEAPKPADVIMHHVLDNHDWHITDYPAGKDASGHTVYKGLALHLPWILYSSRDGLVFSGDAHGLLERGYAVYHDHAYALKPGAEVAEHVDAHGTLHMDKEHWAHFQEEHIDKSVTLLDFSITKTSFQMLLVAVVMLIVFSAVARAYKRNPTGAPKGIQSMFEPFVVFIRDEIAKPYLRDRYAPFLPYLLTLFFFIWFSNLLGLMPFNSNIAGNISVTAALAVLSFLIINFNGSRDYWKHIFAPPGVPSALRFTLMPVVEVIGVFTKPFALMIRLFANITAGHFMVLSLVSLIFILGKNGESLGGALGALPLSLIFTFAIFFLEMIVALIQAYIFTLLTAVFLGMAMESHDHDHGHAHGQDAAHEHAHGGAAH